MSVHPTSHEAPWKAGWRSAQANLVPGITLQVFALAVVLGYYFHEPTRNGLSRLAEVSNDMGVFFGVISTGVFGGLLPLLYLKAVRATRSRVSWSQGFALTGFWAYKGLEIGLWYRFLAWSVGEEPNVSTVAIKTLVDQAVYCPLWAIPTTALFYLWAKTRFDVRAVADDLRAPRWYARRVLPLLYTNTGVWLPLVCIIYALPTPLQLPLQNIVLCFFTLMLAYLSQHQADVRR